MLSSLPFPFGPIPEPAPGTLSPTLAVPRGPRTVAPPLGAGSCSFSQANACMAAWECTQSQTPCIPPRPAARAPNGCRTPFLTRTLRLCHTQPYVCHMSTPLPPHSSLGEPCRRGSKRMVGARVADHSTKTSSSRHSRAQQRLRQHTQTRTGREARERSLVPKFCQKPIGRDHSSSCLELDPRYTCGGGTFNPMVETWKDWFPEVKQKRVGTSMRWECSVRRGAKVLTQLINGITAT